jgi:hypothetical protein
MKILTVDDIVTEDYHLLFPSMIKKLSEKKPEDVFAYAPKLKKILSYDNKMPEQFADNVVDYVKSLESENEKKKEFLSKICYDFKYGDFKNHRYSLDEYAEFLDSRANVEQNEECWGEYTIYNFNFNEETEKKYHEINRSYSKHDKDWVKGIPKLNGNYAFSWLKSVYDRSVELARQNAGKIRWIVEDFESPVRDLFKKEAVPCCLSCSYKDFSQFGYDKGKEKAK